MTTPTDAKTGFRFVEDENTHAYFFGDKPMIGTTTVIGKTIPKPLTWWASGMACAEMGWVNPKNEPLESCLASAEVKLEEIKKMDRVKYNALLNKAYRAFNTSVKKSATKGTDMHDLLEQYITWNMNGKNNFMIPKIIEPFVDWSNKNVKRFLFTEMSCYSTILWCGGTADFGYEDMQGNYVLGDFKSSKEAYFSTWVQLGAYDKQISENGGFTKDGEKMFTLDKPFKYYACFAERAGLDKPFFSDKTELLRRVFSNCVMTYKDMMAFEGK